MRVRSLMAIIVLVLVTAFFVVNWRVFAAPAKIDLLITTIEIPIGVVTLALFAASMLVFLIYVGFWQSTFLMEFRRQAKELQTQRTLAESAEASRFTELGKLIRDEIANSDSRLEAALTQLREELKDTENSIAASLGEMDDRIARGADRAAP
jgi:uncharacterized integral membrane protein